jgi:NAD(P)-binding Rossmann-like domain
VWVVATWQQLKRVPSILGVCSILPLRYERLGDKFQVVFFLFPYFLQIFKRMGIRQIVPPNVKPLKDNNVKIALIGGGPASLSCATFLGRLGYKNLTIYEKRTYLGGLSSSEIPQYRLPIDVVDFEIQLVKDLGVKFETGRALSMKDLTVQVEIN